MEVFFHLSRCQSVLLIIKERKISNNHDGSVKILYSKLYLDLNIDMKTNLDIWCSYEHVLKHYILEGNQLHWLAVSLDVLYRRYRDITRNDNNSILLLRLLMCQLFVINGFFCKLDKWESMANSPDSIRSKN